MEWLAFLAFLTVVVFAITIVALVVEDKKRVKIFIRGLVDAVKAGLDNRVGRN